jgi:hypothetical protein
MELIDELNRALTRRCPLTFFRNDMKIGIKYKGKDVSYIYLNPPIGNSMILELSKTLKTTIDDKEFDFTKRHLNTCLRYLAAMIASKENCYLVSEAINPVSLYTMLKLFDCEIQVYGVFQPQSALTMKEATALFKDLISKTPYVTIRADTRNYDDLARSLFQSIEMIRCADLGGTRKRIKNRMI